MASGIVSGVWGLDKFHFKPIPHSFYKVDVTQVQVGDAPLMKGNQLVVADVIGGSALWNQKHLKA